MIPGNRPDDIAEEVRIDRLWDHVDAFVTKHNLDLEGLDNLESAVSRLVREVYVYAFSEGYTEGDADAADRYEGMMDEHREELHALRDAYENRNQTRMDVDS